MLPATDFLDLIQRARSGNETAWAELVRRFEPFIQRVVRIRMRQHGEFDRVRHDVGSSDVCQSVFSSLFRGLKENRYRLEEPGDLEKLLRVMIRYHVATKARRSWVKLRELFGDFEHAEWPDSAPRPDQQVADSDLVESIQEQFSEEELELVTMWLDELSWAAIGEKLGCTADAARVRLSRAVARVREEFRARDHV